MHEPGPPGTPFPLPTVDEMLRDAADYRIQALVRGLPMSCWKCHADGVAVIAVHVDGYTDAYDVITTESGLPLRFARDVLLVAGHPAAATIKWRTSKTAGRGYESNGCARCDVLFGAFPLQEEIGNVLAAQAIDTLPVLTSAEISELDWLLLEYFARHHLPRPDNPAD